MFLTLNPENVFLPKILIFCLKEYCRIFDFQSVLSIDRNQKDNISPHPRKKMEHEEKAALKTKVCYCRRNENHEQDSLA